MKLLIGPGIVLGYFIFMKSLGMLLGYFSALPYPSNIEPLVVRGAAASLSLKLTFVLIGGRMRNTSGSVPPVDQARADGRLLRPVRLREACQMKLQTSWRETGSYFVGYLPY